MKILLDYVFPISVIAPTPQASTAFLKQACVVVKPMAGKEDEDGKTFLCTNISQVDEHTENEDVRQLFNAGMNRVFILVSSDLDLADKIDLGEFFTLLISSDFTEDELSRAIIEEAVSATLTAGSLAFTAVNKGISGNSIQVEGVDGVALDVSVVGSKITITFDSGVDTAEDIRDAILASVTASALVSVEALDNTPQDAFSTENLSGGADDVYGIGDNLNLGQYKGVTGVSCLSTEVAIFMSKIENRSSFFVKEDKFSNMFFAFGKLLSNMLNWDNQQYIQMPISESITDLGLVELLFDERVSFVLSDDEFGNRLGFFVAGGKAIAAPYIIKNLMIDMQSKALQWITANRPDYTVKEAALLETRIQEDVIQKYVDRSWLESGEVNIVLREQNFVASGEINVPEPKALWRVFGELRQSV